jgi:RsiW-degrading membrane proteinase PrsW (M82 family)
MRRWIPPALIGSATVLAVVTSIFTEEVSVPLVVLAASGAPLTVLVLVRAVMGPGPDERRLWPSVLLGATLVPALVIAFHGVVLAVAYWLIAPFVAPVRELLELLRSHQGLTDLLTTGWAYVLIVEMAVVAPLAEETLKPLGALLRRPRTAADAFLLGAAAGTGFAMAENVLYAGGGWFGFGSAWLPVSVARMLGAGLHAFGAALVCWAFFTARHATSGRWPRLPGAFAVACTAHGVWNGAVAVTYVLFRARDDLALPVSGDAESWGVVLMVLLAGLGTVVLGALLWLGWQVAHGEQELAVRDALDLHSARAIGAWALVTVAALVPATILALVFPEVMAL